MYELKHMHICLPPRAASPGCNETNTTGFLGSLQLCTSGRKKIDSLTTVRSNDKKVSEDKSLDIYHCLNYQ